MNAKSTYVMVSRGVLKLGRVLTVANTLSFFRLALLPFILFLLSSPDAFWARTAALLMIVAFATDALDGWFARRLNQVSLLGEILDPVIDKAYTVSIAIFLIIFKGFPLQIAGVILVRDFLIIALGSFLFHANSRLPRSNWLGKLTGCSYGVTAVAYTIGLSWAVWSAWISLIIALISGGNYLVYFQRNVERQKNRDREVQSIE